MKLNFLHPRAKVTIKAFGYNLPFPITYSHNLEDYHIIDVYVRFGLKECLLCCFYIVYRCISSYSSGVHLQVQPMTQDHSDTNHGIYGIKCVPCVG